MPPPHRLGCVSYLNAKPLIHRLPEEHPGRVALHLEVPARLLDLLLEDRVDVALCPVVDLFRSPRPLELVPIGGIACAGPTLTVRLFSRVPLDQLTAVHVDVDSHTSVALLGVLLREIYGLTPTLIHHPTRAADLPPGTQAALLIGDKVVTAAPDPEDFCHQMDLGEAWHDLTGLPFVFAAWMTRRGRPLGDLPQRLTQQLQRNLQRLDEIVERYAQDHGWPTELAADYLGRILHYPLGPEELRGLARFQELLGHPAEPAADRE